MSLDRKQKQTVDDTVAHGTGTIGATSKTQRHAAKLDDVQRSADHARLDAAWGIQLARDGHTGLDDGEVQQHAARGIAGGGSQLPYLDSIQRSFGEHDVSGVRAHTGGAAAEASRAMGAHGYATGNDVAFAESSPSQFLVAHEAAHVVQQRAGVSLKGAVGQAGDAYEQNADAVAARVVAGQSARDLLGPAGHGGGAAVQRDAKKADAGAKTADEPEDPTLAYAKTPAEGGAKLAFFFTGQDAFGTAAKAYVAAYYPDHKQFAAKSFEEMFSIIGAEAAAMAKPHSEGKGDDKHTVPGVVPHIDEIIMVSHANSAGGMKISLTDDNPKRRYTPADLSALQKETKAHLHQSFTSKRLKALAAIDDTTRVIVRGCELGKSADAMDGLRTIFGGQPTVLAPTDFQGFSIEQIGAHHRLETAVQAFDVLVTEGYIDASLKALDDAHKKAYIADHFPHGIPTDFFIVGEDAHKAFAAMSKKDKMTAPGEKVKTRVEDPTDVSVSSTFDKDGQKAHWAASVGGPLIDPSLDALPREELVRRAEDLFDPFKPGNGVMILRLERAWQTHSDARGQVSVSDAAKQNPLDIPTVFRDLQMSRAKADAIAHPGPVQDAFAGADLDFTNETGTDDFRVSEDMGAVDHEEPAAPKATPAVKPPATVKPPAAGHAGVKHHPWPSKGKGRVDLIDPPAGVLGGVRLWAFPAGVADSDDNQDVALNRLAHDFKTALTHSDKRKIVISGRASFGEDAAMGAARAKAVAAKLHKLGVGDDYFIDVHGGPAGTDKSKNGMEHDRQVEIRLRESVDHVQVDQRGDSKDREEHNQNIHNQAPPASKWGDTPGQVDTVLAAKDAAMIFVDSIAVEGIGLIPTAFKLWWDALTVMDEGIAAAQVQAYKSGLTHGSGNAWALIYQGQSQVKEAEVWAITERLAHWSDFLPANRQEAEVPMSQGVHVSVDIYDHAMEKAETQTRYAIYDLLRREKRNVNAEWEGVYNKVILDIRKAVATKLDAEIKLTAKGLQGR